MPFCFVFVEYYVFVKGGQKMYSIFEELLQKYGVSTYKVSKDTGIAQSVFSSWKNGVSTPKQDKMQIIADYFNVSIEYLMTGKESSGYYLNEETAKLAQEMFEDEDMRSLFDMKRKMPPERFKAHMEFMKNLLKTNKIVRLSNYTAQERNMIIPYFL